MVSIILPDSSPSCIIPVCHGSQDMHGKRFLSYVQEASKYYSHCHLVVCDTLDVYNMAPSQDLWNEALETSRAMGDRWIRKHLRQVNEAFSGKITLTRWDDIKSDNSFKAKHNEAKRLYKESTEVRSWIDNICRMYAEIAAQRQRNSGFLPDVENLFQRSVNYMLEEIAGTSIYYNWYQSPAVYPGQYFDDPQLFNRQNPSIDLSVPAHCEVIFENDWVKAA